MSASVSLVQKQRQVKLTSSVVSLMKPCKHHSMNLSDTITTCVTIFTNILRYTNSISKRTPSIFDMPLPQRTSIETDSESDESDSDNQEMEIEPFVIRCVNYLNLDHHLLVLSMMTLDKLLKSGFILTERNVQRFVFTIFVAVQKFFSDESFTNKAYAKVGFVDCNELLNLELTLMDMLEFNMFISDVQYEVYNKKFEKFWKRE